MVDQYRGSGLLPSVTAEAPRVYTPREVNRIARDQIALEEAAKARASGEVAMKAAAEDSRRRRTAAAQARMQDPQAEAVYQGQQADQEFGDVVGALSARAPTREVANPAYPATRRYTDKMLGTPEREGLVEQVEPLTQRTDAALVAREQIAAEAMQSAADQHKQANEQLYANQQAQARRQGEQLDRVRRANDLAAATADKFAATAEVDPGRYWRDAPAWQKFTAVLAAGLLGWAGRTDPTAHITNAIATDIEAQKAAIAKASQRVGDSREQSGLETSLYHQVLAQTGSEREADLIYTQALLQHAQSEMAARLTKAGVTVLNEQQKAAFNGLQQEVANVTRQLELTAATNVPSRLVGGGPAIADRDVRGLLVAKGKADIARRGASDASVVDTAQKREASGAKLEEARLQHGPDSLEERKLQREMRKDQTGGEKGAAVETALRLTQDYLDDYADDIPGRTEGGVGGEAYFHEPSWWQSAAGKRESKQRNLLSQWYATALTGANVSETQEKFLDDLARNHDMSGDEIRAGLKDLQRSLEIYQSTYQRTAEEGAQADYRGVSVDELPQRDPKTGGMQRNNRPGGVADEAERLGGTLR